MPDGGVPVHHYGIGKDMRNEVVTETGMEHTGFSNSIESDEYCSKIFSVFNLSRLLNRTSRSFGNTDAVSSKDSSRITSSPYRRELRGTTVDIVLKNSITSKPADTSECLYPVLELKEIPGAVFRMRRDCQQ